MQFPTAKELDASPHEASKRIFRCADNGLAAHVKTCVHKHGTTGQLLEPRDQSVVARVRFLMNGRGPLHSALRATPPSLIVTHIDILVKLLHAPDIRREDFASLRGVYTGGDVVPPAGNASSVPSPACRSRSAGA
jgi:hypothetical protein